MAAIGWVAVVLGGITVLTLLRGLVLTVLWHWFIVPLFPVPYLNVGQAIGLSLVVGFLVYQWQDTDDEKSTAERVLKPLVVGLVYYPLVFAVAAVIHIWVP